MKDSIERKRKMQLKKKLFGIVIKITCFRNPFDLKMYHYIVSCV